MATMPESTESVKERTRRALADNPEIELPPVAESAGYADQVDSRLRAIRLVRDLEPRRANHAERVRDLSRTLADTPGDSIHYRNLLERLRESHDAWMSLEEQVWAANYTIRSTQWLLAVLSDPNPTLTDLLPVPAE